MKEKILETLFETRCTIAEEYYKNEDVKLQEQKLEELMNRMNSELTDKQQILLEEIVDVQCDLDLMMNLEYFKQGVCIGVQMLMEVKEAYI